MSQRIVIPKGLINPNEITVIEIPADAQHIKTVIAKPIHQKDSRYCNKCDFYGKGDQNWGTVNKLNKTCMGDEKNIERESVHVSGINHLTSIVNGKKSSYGTSRKDNIFDEYENRLDSEDVTYYNPNFKINYQKNSTPNIDVKHVAYCSLESSTSSARTPKLSKLKGKKISTLDVQKILNIMDQLEIQKLQNNLLEYQTARRKLIYETTNLHSIKEIFENFDNQKY